LIAMTIVIAVQVRASIKRKKMLTS
jgi:hypothetical protein